MAAEDSGSLLEHPKGTNEQNFLLWKVLHIKEYEGEISNYKIYN